MDYILVVIIFALIAYLHNYFLKKRNRDSIKTIENLEDIQDSNFCLYLRSFNEDSFKRQDWSGSLFMPFGTPPKEIDLSVFEQIGNNMQLVKVSNSKSGEYKIGASQIMLEDDWKEKVLDLMQRSNCIILKPSSTGGLLWELDQIFENNYLDKTIFIASYGSENIREIEKEKKNRFLELLHTQYGVNIKKTPYGFSRGMIHFFTISNNTMTFWGRIKDIIKYQKTLTQNTSNI